MSEVMMPGRGGGSKQDCYASLGELIDVDIVFRTEFMPNEVFIYFYEGASGANLCCPYTTHGSSLFGAVVAGTQQMMYRGEVNGNSRGLQLSTIVEKNKVTVQKAKIMPDWGIAKMMMVYR